MSSGDGTAATAATTSMTNPLSTACIRTLSDKAQEKRRAAAAEIEKYAL